MGKRKYKYEIPDELDKEIQREMGKHSVKELTDEQVDELIHRAESGNLRSEDVEIIRWGFKTLSWLYRLLEFKNISMSGFGEDTLRSLRGFFKNQYLHVLCQFTGFRQHKSSVCDS